MLIYLAGLQNVPKVLFEDASLLGAGIWTKVKSIILPSMVPVIITVIFIQMISGMQVFAEVYIMTNGSPEGASEVIATYIYKSIPVYGYRVCFRCRGIFPDTFNIYNPAKDEHPWQKEEINGARRGQKLSHNM